MIRPRARLLVTLALLLGLTLPPSGVVEAQQPPAPPTPTGPAHCHLIGRATKSAERLSATQFAVSLAVDRVLGVPPNVEPPATPFDTTVLVNSTYGASFYRPFDIKTGTSLEVAGYVRAGGQCVVDTLNVGTLSPGFEGYIRPTEVCPTAGDETISVYERASVSLGCAVSPMFQAPTAVQRFQNGVMLHLKGIYVLEYAPAAYQSVPIDGGVWSGARDAWREPESPSAGLAPPAGFFEPLRGFGKAWREQHGGPEGSLGWALEDEATEDASWQLFEKGIIVVTRAGEGLIMYHDGRVWELKPR